MDKRIQNFISTIKDDGGKLAKNEINTFLSWALDESDLLAKEHKEKLEQYMLQLALGEITPADLQTYMRSFKRQVEAKLLEAGISKDAAAQRIVDGIQNLIIDNLLKFL